MIFTATLQRNFRSKKLFHIWVQFYCQNLDSLENGVDENDGVDNNDDDKNDDVDDDVDDEDDDDNNDDDDDDDGNDDDDGSGGNWSIILSNFRNETESIRPFISTRHLFPVFKENAQFLTQAFRSVEFEKIFEGERISWV